MIQEWSTGRFALVMILFVIFSGYILAQFFDPQIIAAIGVVTAIVSPILQHYWKTARQDPNDPEEDDTADTTDQLLSDEEQETDDTADPEKKLANDTTDPRRDTDDAAETPTLRRQSSLLRSNEDIIEEVEENLGDRVEFFEDGTIDLHGDDLNLYSEMMLYVIAKRLAYEDQLVETAAVTVDELRRETGDKEYDYNRMEVALFLDMAGGRLTPSYSINIWTRNLDYDNLENIEFSAGLKNVSELADWTLDEPSSSPLDLSIGLNNAAGWLGDAADTDRHMNHKQRTTPYYDPEEDFEQLCEYVLMACSEAKLYPVEIRRDSVWKKFTRYSAGVLRGVESVSHHLPIAEEYLEKMQNIADEERGG